MDVLFVILSLCLALISMWRKLVQIAILARIWNKSRREQRCVVLLIEIGNKSRSERPTVVLTRKYNESRSERSSMVLIKDQNKARNEIKNVSTKTVVESIHEKASGRAQPRTLNAIRVDASRCDLVHFCKHGMSFSLDGTQSSRNLK